MASTLDALIAETLGDVLRLHDAVTELKQQLPEMTRQAAQEMGSLTKQAEGRLATAASNLVSAAQILQEQRERQVVAVIGPEGIGRVKSGVDAALGEWTKAIEGSLQEAMKSGLEAGIKVTRDEIGTAARALQQAHEEQQDQRPGWKTIGQFAAACLVSAVIGGLVVAWIVQPAAAGRQDLPLESGQKIDAGKQKQR